MTESQDVIDIIDRNINVAHYKNVPSFPDDLDENIHAQAFWIMKESRVPSLRVDMPIPYQEMFEEAIKQKHLFVKHRGSTSPGWASMAIHGTAVEDTAPREALINEGKYTQDNCPEYHWTELSDLCPITTQWLKEELNFDLYNRVRFMLLEPGGYITPHRDTDIPGLHAYNISLNNPEGHIFAMDGHGIVPWQPGELRILDISNIHTVVNRSSEPRIHMIVHGHYGEKFKHRMIKSYKKLAETFND